MDPASPRRRPTPMRPVALTLAALLLPLTAAACSGDDDGEVASDPAATAESTAEPTAESSSASPSEEPAAYPDFEPADYSYTLTVQCFCMDANQPVRVTVAGGEVSEAVYAEGAGQGTDGQVQPGAPAGESSRLSINDIIERANDPEIDAVEVDWPEGQDHPDRVSLDRAAGATDDEVVYLLADVVVG